LGNKPDKQEEASALRGDQISSWGQAEHCSACRSDQIPTQSRGKEKTTGRSKMKISSAWGQADQRKGATNQQIEGEPLTSIAKVSTPTFS